MDKRKQVVLVTGASRGIGLAVTTLLLEKFGVIVVALSRTKRPAIQELLAKYSSTFLFISCDIADPSALTSAISLAHKTFTHIDALVLNAGILEPTGKITSAHLSLDAWRSHFETNLFSNVCALRETIPWLRQSDAGGRVVFVSSGAATGGTYGWGPYNASKAAQNSLCRTLAQEEPSIVSVAVRPGKVDTDMQAEVRGSHGRMREEDRLKFVKEHEEGTLVDPCDCGYVIAGLALRAPMELTGKFVSWDSEEVRDFWDGQ